MDLDGTEVGLGEPCTAVTRADVTSDNCAAQLYCASDRCVQICDPETPACDVGQCVTDPSLFAEVGIVFAGLCVD
jgi:hypothetical protein